MACTELVEEGSRWKPEGCGKADRPPQQDNLSTICNWLQSKGCPGCWRDPRPCK